ncbi:hypothetical protein A0128_02385 [Leptospira tipperaryensis]|uniref:Uncharacterized protein n=1 Tax=Leptospira tipperaryensis TaxID=2564040 RepID=A0A1D7UTF2_9LEPT|nr:hypothetical protein [Leptospira tipperaryensis]AOP32818.1 hypothetical protein A0128_02385 [Leptospira tipperaryensis]
MNSKIRSIMDVAITLKNRIHPSSSLGFKGLERRRWVLKGVLRIQLQILYSLGNDTHKVSFTF